MGVFDWIKVYMFCPYCKSYEMISAQTKDLDPCMKTYHPVEERLFKKKNKTKWDKTDLKEQKERAEVPRRLINKINFIDVSATCPSAICKMWKREAERREFGYAMYTGGRHFDGKVKVIDGYLVGDIYDLKLLDKKMPKRETKLDPVEEGTGVAEEVKLLKEIFYGIKFPEIKESR